MPELPEVEVISSTLNVKLKNLVVNKINIVDINRLPKPSLPLTNYKIKKIFRLGKTIVIHFNKAANNIYLELHLRMTGRLLLEKNNKKEVIEPNTLVYKILSKSPKNTSKHIRASIELDKGILLFIDPRRFGTFFWHTTEPTLRVNTYDALDLHLNPEICKSLLLKYQKKNIKNFLMDQKSIIGIGNIYASEILFLTKVFPTITLSEIPSSKRMLLFENIKKVLELAIKNKGTTFSDYQREDGSSGNFQNLLKVYGRENLPCKICQTPIKRMIQAQRSTFFCPSCQADSRSSLE
jgi:formamidopyrimidine-DNA glycosylase